MFLQESFIHKIFLEQIFVQQIFAKKFFPRNVSPRNFCPRHFLPRNFCLGNVYIITFDLNFWEKFVVQILDSRISIFNKHLHFYLKFWRKKSIFYIIKAFVRNLSFGQKSKFYRKYEIWVKYRIFLTVWPEKIKFLRICEKRDNILISLIQLENGF